MAWTKPFKVLQDFILGYQQVNQAIANEKAMRDEYDGEHQVPGGPQSIQRTAPLPAGRHVYDNIPKAVVAVDVSTFSVFGATHGSADTVLSVPPYVLGVERVGVGQYSVRTAYLPELAEAPWAEAGVKTTAIGVVRTIAVRWDATTQAFVVTTLELVSGAFTPKDFSFSLTIYSR